MDSDFSYWSSSINIKYMEITMTKEQACKFYCCGDCDNGCQCEGIYCGDYKQDDQQLKKYYVHELRELQAMWNTIVRSRSAIDKNDLIIHIVSNRDPQDTLLFNAYTREFY